MTWSAARIVRRVESVLRVHDHKLPLTQNHGAATQRMVPSLLREVLATLGPEALSRGTDLEREVAHRQWGRIKLLLDDPDTNDPWWLCQQLNELIIAGLAYERDVTIDQCDSLFGRALNRVDTALAGLRLHILDRVGPTAVVADIIADAALPGVCRHFAAALSYMFAVAKRATRRFEQCHVVTVAGDPETDGGLHAWNWFVDCRVGTIIPLEPQSGEIATGYANASAFALTIMSVAERTGHAAAFALAAAMFGPPETVQGATLRFQLARQPIAAATRWHICDVLAEYNFDRIVPEWRDGLIAADEVHGECNFAEATGILAGKGADHWGSSSTGRWPMPVGQAAHHPSPLH